MMHRNKKTVQLTAAREVILYEAILLINQYENTVIKAGEVLACDTLVLSLRVRVDEAYIQSFENCAADVTYIGDCNTKQKLCKFTQVMRKDVLFKLNKKTGFCN